MNALDTVLPNLSPGGGRAMPYIFVYGSLLNPREFEEKIEPSTCRPALLRGYGLVFNKKSRSRCAAANIVECEGCSVAGISCIADESALSALDAREARYKRITITVYILGGGKVDAFTYMSSDLCDAQYLKGCLGDERLEEYIQTIAEGLARWDSAYSGFAEKYLSLAQKSSEVLIGPEISDKIMEMLKKALEATSTS